MIKRPPKYLLGMSAPDGADYVIQTRNPVAIATESPCKSAIDVWSAKLWKNKGLKEKNVSTMRSILKEYCCLSEFDPSKDEAEEGSDFAFWEGRIKPPEWMIADALDTRPDLEDYAFIIHFWEPYFVMAFKGLDGLVIEHEFTGDVHEASQWAKKAGEQFALFNQILDDEEFED